MSKRYTHSFDTRVNIRIESDIEDFEEAINDWLSQFPDNATKRAALLNGHESTKTLIDGVIFNQTDDNVTGQTTYP